MPALRSPVGERATSPRSPESQIGQIGGSAQASRGVGEQRYGVGAGRNKSGGPTGTGPKGGGRAGRERVRADPKRLGGRFSGTEGQADNRGRTYRPEGAANSGLVGNTKDISQKSESSY